MILVVLRGTPHTKGAVSVEETRHRMNCRVGAAAGYCDDEQRFSVDRRRLTNGFVQLSQAGVEREKYDA